jgi:hypothetical protein
MWGCHGKDSIEHEEGSSHQQIGITCRKIPVKCCIWSVALCGAEIWILRKVDQKYLGSFEMWCCRRMEKISSIDSVRNEEVLHRVKEERNILHTVKRGKANWIGQILRGNCLVKQVIGGKIKGRIEVTGRRGRRRKKVLDVLKEKNRILEIEEALDRNR